MLHGSNLRGHWLDIHKFTKEFSNTIEHLPCIVKSAKSEATNTKYDSYFMKFKLWCVSKSFSYLPASATTVALFLGDIIQQRVSVSVLDAYFYSISWVYSVSLNSNPCEEKFIKYIVEGGTRILAQPVQKKESITTDT